MCGYDPFYWYELELDRTEYERYTESDYNEIQAEMDEALLWDI